MEKIFEKDCDLLYRACIQQLNRTKKLTIQQEDYILIFQKKFPEKYNQVPIDWPYLDSILKFLANENKIKIPKSKEKFNFIYGIRLPLSFIVNKIMINETINSPSDSKLKEN